MPPRFYLQNADRCYDTARLFPPGSEPWAHWRKRATDWIGMFWQATFPPLVEA